ncbi:MAG: hypothetical protein OEM52_01425 [bacterium]|nr:hypothetical protein [bacterium]
MKKYRVILLSSLAVVIFVGVAWAWTTICEQFMDQYGVTCNDNEQVSANSNYRATLDMVHTQSGATVHCKVIKDGVSVKDFTLKTGSTSDETYYFMFPTTGTYTLQSTNISNPTNLDAMVHWQVE